MTTANERLKLHIGLGTGFQLSGGAAKCLGRKRPGGFHPSPYLSNTKHILLYKNGGLPLGDRTLAIDFLKIVIGEQWLGIPLSRGKNPDADGFVCRRALTEQRAHARLKLRFGRPSSTCSIGPGEGLSLP